MPAQPDLPLRPMTLGELLDAAMTLLRRRALPLLAAAAVLAGAEQVVLAPLRRAAGLEPPYFWLGDGFGTWWTLVALGFALEAGIITLLAALAAGGVGPALLGRPAGDRELWRTSRPVATTVTAIIAAGAGGVGAIAGLLPWFIAYGLFGLAAPALVIERKAHPLAALGRSARLAARLGLRGFRIQAVAYLTWFAIRLAFGTGWIALLGMFTGTTLESVYWAVPIAWALANTVAYPALACMSAVLLVETRIRTEGLDIAINRARSRGEDEAAVLVYQS